MAGATLAQVLAQMLRNRREDKLKYAEARARLLELIHSQPTRDQRGETGAVGALLERVNAFNRWLVTVSPHLNQRQLDDISVLTSQAVMATDERAPHSPDDFKRWSAANNRLFPTRDRRSLIQRVKGWRKRRLLAAKKPLEQLPAEQRTPSGT